MPAPPSRSSIFPTGALLPATFKTLLAQWFDYMLPLLGNTGDAADARAALGAAADSEVVKLAGSQTIPGAKTFSVSPVIPNASASNHPASKSQLDAETSARTAAIAAAVAPATVAPTLFVETAYRELTGLSAVEWSPPSWARRITIVVVNASGASTGVCAVRIGTSGAAATTGYTGTCREHAGNTSVSNSVLWNLATSATAGDAFTFRVTIVRSHNNYWVYESSGCPVSGTNNIHGCGQVNLAGALGLVQLLITGSDVWDGGIATLFYE